MPRRGQGHWPFVLMKRQQNARDKWVGEKLPPCLAFSFPFKAWPKSFGPQLSKYTFDRPIIAPKHGLGSGEKICKFNLHKLNCKNMVSKGKKYIHSYLLCGDPQENIKIKQKSSVES